MAPEWWPWATKEKELSRTIHVHRSAMNEEAGFCNNTVKTSKYTVVNFVPKNLFEQFHRIANIYFLCITCLQQIPTVSPLGSGTTFMALMVVLTVTALKEAWEDYKRHRNDAGYNNKRVDVLEETGRMGTKRAQELRVGDIIRVSDGEFFPADLMLLSTSEPEGMCYIETKNLDGETNLKERQALAQTAKLKDNITKLHQLEAVVTCEGPNNHIESFEGSLVLGKGKRTRIENRQILLNGCMLKNSAWVYAVVVYTGGETKLAQQTSGIKDVKKVSHIEKQTNRLIVLIFSFELLLCFISAVGNGTWLSAHATDAYLALDEVTPASEAAVSFFTFIILYSNLIPISLYVSMETVKLGQATLMMFDRNMYYEDDDSPIPMKARTSNLNEELGQVEYIFSDKTGTLTCNNLVFVNCSIGGIAFGKGTGSAKYSTPQTAHQFSKELSEMSASSYYTSNSAQVTPRTASDSKHAKRSTNKRRGGRAVSFENSSSSSSSYGGGGSGRKHAELSTISSASSDPNLRASITVTALSPASARKVDDSFTKSTSYYSESEQEEDESFGAGVGYSLSEQQSQSTSSTYADSYEDTSSRDSTSSAAHSSSSSSGFHTPPRARRGNRGSSAAHYGGMSAASDTPMGQGVVLEHVQFEDEGNRMAAAMHDPATATHIELYMLNLALNHTVIPRNEPDLPMGVKYQAGSPDEGALVNTATFFGCQFHTRTPTTYTIDAWGRERTYEMLHFNFFDNTRKRMSVVCRDPEGRVLCFVKGADSSILPFVRTETENDRRVHDSTNQHLTNFAAMGLRTLVMAFKELTPSEYKAFAAFAEKVADLPSGPKGSEKANHKEEMQQRLYRMVEVDGGDLILLGASAIEDRLQDGVPETIEVLRQAGIKVWVLTGDKQDTAIQIGYSCNLLSHDAPVIILNDTGDSKEWLAANPPNPHASEEEKIERAKQAETRARSRMLPVLQKTLKDMKREREAKEAVGETALFQCALDGHTLEAILGHPGQAEEEEDDLMKTCAAALLAITSQCKSVIGCRVSPAQKAQVVTFVEEALHPITLAIGDGANDVVMIKAAHIGIGISGLEGMQASNASDYAFGQFRFLSELLLVHGHWSYHRVAKLIYYSFYKNISIALIPFWFMFFCGFSGQTFVEKWTFTLFNITFTALPILVVGLYDQCLSRDHLLTFPELYRSGIRKRFFNTQQFVGWLALAIYHSLCMFFGTQWIINHNVVSRSGSALGLFANGVFIMSVVVVTVTAKVSLETNNWTVLNFIAVGLSLLGYFVWIIAYSHVFVFTVSAADMYGVGDFVYRSGVFWLAIVFIPSVCLIPDVVYKFVKRTWFYEPYDIVREMSEDDLVDKRILDVGYNAGRQSILQTVSFRTLARHGSRTFAFEIAPATHARHATNMPPTGRNVSEDSYDFSSEDVGDMVIVSRRKKSANKGKSKGRKAR